MKSSYRWFLVFFLLILSAINYGDRSALGVAAGPLKHDLNLSNAAFGIISGAFAFGYAPFNLIGGILGDRFSPKRTLNIFVALWSITILALPLATGYTFMVINRALFGVSEGPNYALSTKISSRWLRRQELGLGLSIVTMGSPLGVAVLVPCFGAVVAALGWRAAFLVLGGLSVLWLLVSIVVVANTPEQSRFVSAAERAHIEADQADPDQADPAPTTATATGPAGAAPKVSWRAILSNSSIQAAAVAYFCFAYTNYMLLSWLPTYFDQTYGYDLQHSAIASAVPWVGAVAGSVVSGVVSDQLLKRTGNARLARGVVIGVSLVAVAVLMWLVTQASSGPQGVALLTAALFFLYATNGLYYVIGASIGPSGAVARATGYIQAIASIPGFLGPAVTGFLISGHGGFTGAFSVAAAVVLLGGLVSFVGITMKRIAVPPTAVVPQTQGSVRP